MRAVCSNLPGNDTCRHTVFLLCVRGFEVLRTESDGEISPPTGQKPIIVKRLYTIRPPPKCLDLKGRMLVQNGDFFSLLPIRHVPVEAPYAASFEKISHAAEHILIAPEASEHLLRVFSDGSASQQRQNDAREGGAAVVVYRLTATFKKPL